jgi:hypothetical protein
MIFIIMRCAWTDRYIKFNETADSDYSFCIFIVLVPGSISAECGL